MPPPESVLEEIMDEVFLPLTRPPVTVQGEPERLLLGILLVEQVDKLPAASVHAWPMQHPAWASLACSTALIAVFAPLAARLYRRRTLG